MDRGHDPQPADIPSNKDWQELAKNLVRAEMIRRGVSFVKLPKLLKTMGGSYNGPNLRNKVGRGRFSAVFFLQCIRALGIAWIHMPAAVSDTGQLGSARTLVKGVQDRSGKVD